MNQVQSQGQKREQIFCIRFTFFLDTASPICEDAVNRTGERGDHERYIKSTYSGRNSKYDTGGRQRNDKRSLLAYS